MMGPDSYSMVAPNIYVFRTIFYSLYVYLLRPSDCASILILCFDSQFFLGGGEVRKMVKIRSPTSVLGALSCPDTRTSVLSCVVTAPERPLRQSPARVVAASQPRLHLALSPPPAAPRRRPCGGRRHHHHPRGLRRTPPSRGSLPPRQWGPADCIGRLCRLP